ncbi:MAG: Gfo/Idh/MocA family oxidoreductase [Planctomycetota bacterium]
MTPSPSRREVLTHGSAAALGISLPSFPSPFVRLQDAEPAAPGGAEMLKVGLIGCGGRGTGAAAQALRADPNTKLVALADAFGDQLESSLASLQATEDIAAKVDVDEDHRFTGFDGYKGVIESCDVVLMATSPFFRPQHVEACVEAGRHMFVEKPVATDGPGLRRIWQACRDASAKGLSVVSGLCYRYQFAKQETMKRVHDGEIGDITAMQCTYNTGELWHRGNRPEWSQMEFQMRNWLYFAWLSGDHIAEQHIHSLDKIAWAKGAYPVKCTSSGGRIKRTGEEYGNVYDHFNTVYEWEDGVKGFSSCRQWHGTKHDVSDHVFGTKGVAHLQTHRIESEAGRWRYRGEGPDDMYQNEHDALFKAIRDGEPINNGDYMCQSSLMALMGRLAAYTGKEITADEALNSQEDLSPPALEWGDVETRPVAVPGIKQFV